MLVLDRRIHEGFWIENRIFVKVLNIGRKRVKLGIEAPADLPIVRDELRARNGGGETTHEADRPSLSERSFREARRR